MTRAKQPKTPMSPALARRLRRQVDRAGAVPRGKRKLFIIEAAASVKSRRELDRIVEAIQLVLCPYDPATPHRCPRPWFIIVHPADAKERREWKPLLEE